MDNIKFKVNYTIAFATVDIRRIIKESCIKCNSKLSCIFRSKNQTWYYSSFRIKTYKGYGIHVRHTRVKYVLYITRVNDKKNVFDTLLA